MSRVKSFFFRLSNQIDGISAIEFALLAPFLMFLYLGSIELSFLMETDRKVTKAASTMSDLSGRFEQLDSDALDDIHHAARMIFLPDNVSEARLRITSFTMIDDKPTVEWSVHCNWSGRIADSEIVDIPESVEPSFGSTIMTEVELPVESTFGFVFSVTKTLEDTSYSRPRESSNIPLDPADLSYTCPFQGA